MRKIIIMCIMLLNVCCLTSCIYYNSPRPTADITAVVLGDTEKQVLEKAGEPLSYFGREDDIFIYGYVADEQYKYKIVWFRDGKVSMLGESGKGYTFSVTEIAESHDFVDLGKLIILWHDGMDMYETVGFLGTEYECITDGIYNSEHIYALPNGALRLQFYGTQLTKVTDTSEDGEQKVLWQEDLPIDRVQLGDTKKEVEKKVGKSEEFIGSWDNNISLYTIREGHPEEYKILWFDENNKLYMMAEEKSGEIENWEIAKGHKFLSFEEAKEYSGWAADRSYFYIIGLLGPRYTMYTYGSGIIVRVLTYTYDSGEALIFECPSGLLSEVRYKDAASTETELWDDSHAVRKKDGTPVL